MGGNIGFYTLAAAAVGSQLKNSTGHTAQAGVKLKNNSYETQVGAAKALARSPSPSMAPSPPHLIEPPCR